MKAASVYSSSYKFDELLLALFVGIGLLVLVLSGLFLQESVVANATTTPTPPVARFSLYLSGAVTAQLDTPLSSQLENVCSPFGFYVTIPKGETPYVLSVSFAGLPTGQLSATNSYVLGSSTPPLILTVNGRTFTAYQGTVTDGGSTRRFSALLIDDAGRRLRASGRLSCP